MNCYLEHRLFPSISSTLGTCLLCLSLERKISHTRTKPHAHNNCRVSAQYLQCGEHGETQRGMNSRLFVHPLGPWPHTSTGPERWCSQATLNPLAETDSLENCCASCVSNLGLAGQYCGNLSKWFWLYGPLSELGWLQKAQLLSSPSLQIDVGMLLLRWLWPPSNWPLQRSYLGQQWGERCVWDTETSQGVLFAGAMQGQCLLAGGGWLTVMSAAMVWQQLIGCLSTFISQSSKFSINIPIPLPL